jgi:hypothetical protein
MEVDQALTGSTLQYTQVPIAQSGARNPKMAKNSLLKNKL